MRTKTTEQIDGFKFRFVNCYLKFPTFQSSWHDLKHQLRISNVWTAYCCSTVLFAFFRCCASYCICKCQQKIEKFVQEYLKTWQWNIQLAKVYPKILLEMASLYNSYICTSESYILYAMQLIFVKIYRSAEKKERHNWEVSLNKLIGR